MYLTRERIEEIRDTANGLLRGVGYALDDTYRRIIETTHDGVEVECLHLHVPRAGDTIDGVDAVVTIQCEVNDLYPDCYI